MNKRTARRTPISGVRNVLTVQGKDPNYVYRIVNDEGDRIAQFQERGYEIVTDQNIQVGDRRIANPTKEGTAAQVRVGGGQTAFVMRIKKEFYEEDQAAKKVHNDEIEAAMKREAKKNADYGKLDISGT